MLAIPASVSSQVKADSAHAVADTTKQVQSAADRQLGELTVTAVRRTDTEAATIQAAKRSANVVNNVSAQEIKRTQDSNAGEVIRRIPGVSLIDDKFVMVRGLSAALQQRVDQWRCRAQFGGRQSRLLVRYDSQWSDRQPHDCEDASR